jgi:hypothetical protein
MTTPKCRECGQVAPIESSDMTIAAMPQGWRVTRVRNAEGLFEAAMYCPECWQAIRNRKAAGG